MTTNDAPPSQPLSQEESDELRVSALKESLWTSFINRDPSKARLEALLGVMWNADPELMPPARTAHVLMLLGRPRDALAYLEGSPDPLSVAQRALVLVQIAREEHAPHFYAAVAAGVKHFGPIETKRDMGAQMRLEYALGMAETELGNEVRGREHMHTAVTLALMLGNMHMEPSVTAYLLKSDAMRDPRRTLERLLDVIGESARLDNRVQVQHTAIQARDVLLRLNAYDELPALAAKLPAYVDSGWWAAAARSLCNPLEVNPPDLDLTLDDGFMLSARAFGLLLQASRLRDSGHYTLAAKLAAKVIGLPSWKVGYNLPTQEVAFKLAQVQCYLLVGQPEQATRLLGQLDREGLRLQGPLHQFYFAVTLCRVLSMGGTYPSGMHPEQVVRSGLDALASLPEHLTAEVATRALMTTGAGVYIMASLPNAPRALVDVAMSQVALLNEDGLTRRGLPVANWPHERGAAVFAALARGEKMDDCDRQTLRRARAVIEGQSIPVVVESEVRRALDLLRRDARPRYALLSERMDRVGAMCAAGGAE